MTLRSIFVASVVAFALAAVLRGQVPIDVQLSTATPTPADPFAEMRQRLDALELENRQLKNYLLQRLPPPEGEFVAPFAGDSPIASVAEAYFASHGAAPSGSEPIVTASGAGQGAVVGNNLAMTATWRNGLELSTADKAFRVHVGGRWQFDTSWFSVADAVQNNLPGGVQYHEGVDFRRARLRIDGTMYETMEFAMEYDFVNGFRERNAAATNDINVTALTDMWLQFSHLPIGNLRIGNQKEAIGFEHIVSSRFLPFMERSYNQDTLYGGSYNGFTPGAALFSNFWEDRASWNIGLYKPTNNVFGFNVNDGDYGITGRLTYLPVYADEGRQVLHLGISGRQATTYNDRLRFRTRDAIRAGVSSQWPVPADVTALGSTVQWINTELAAVHGPWTFQAEWMLSFLANAQRVDGTGAGVGPRVESLFYQGGYVQVLYFLTGESDNYSLERMAFDRVKPFENFFYVRDEEGCAWWAKGAWQVGARYNLLDLNDQGINGGQLHNFTTGLNWFFNPNTKWQFNYIATYRDVAETATFPDGSGWIHGWGMRFAQDF